MVGYMNNVLSDCEGDEQLFTRYMFKFIKYFEDPSSNFLKTLKENRFEFTEFQRVMLSAMMDKFNVLDREKYWFYTEDKLQKPFGYEGGFTPTKWDMKNTGLKERNIYIL